jgi:MEMO1 family protein
MHLPYVKKRIGARRCTVVAIMVGSTSSAAEQRYGELLAPYLADPTSKLNNCTIKYYYTNSQSFI